MTKTAKGKPNSGTPMHFGLDHVPGQATQGIDARRQKLFPMHLFTRGRLSERVLHAGAFFVEIRHYLLYLVRCHHEFA
eukprot:CAMPEP_0179333416 /NCGR_PEP_ID=MMETSP0797-20121207/65302_1 /TAXON_ID=47934 /ORGANISM="Dinophysis acuminata, Strain DAEP01" /LENGTH=77 /DNA_ID=CAMNT_0021046443 /DNA_START=12 /DNA_END=242 /DNA_ORIENTATION=+